MCDYAWHVQSGSGDVINLFQQETDAWMSHTDTHNDIHAQTHTRLLSGKQSQRHGVTETKPQKRCLALCDNPLTHIYIQGLDCASVPLSPPTTALCSNSPPPLPQSASNHPSSPLLSTTFHWMHPFPYGVVSPSSSSASHPVASSLIGYLCLSVVYRGQVHGLAWQLP